MKFISFFLPVFLLFSINPGLVVAGAEDEEKQKAWEIYKEAKQAFTDQENAWDDKKFCLDIEEKLLEAISIISEDTEHLRYTIVEKRLVPGKGRWVEYEDVEIPYDKKYFPNRLLSKIREKYPPRPWAVVNIIEDDKGKKNIQVTLENRGATRMDDIRVVIKADFWRYLQAKKISSVKPGENRRLKWEASDARGLNVEFEEKFNYVPKKIRNE